MKVEYKDNSSLGPGNGILTFTDAVIPESPWSIAIQRASDQYFLTGKKGKQWVGEIIYIPLKGMATMDGALELMVGPRVVDSLDQREQYRIMLKGADEEPLKGRLRVETITYSPSGSLGNMALAPDAPDEPEPESPDFIRQVEAPKVEERADSAVDNAMEEEARVAEGAGLPQEEIGETGTPEATQDGLDPQAAYQGAEYGQVYPGYPQEKRKSGLWWLWILLILLLLAAAAAGGWYYYTHYMAKGNETPEEPKVEEEAPPQPEQPAAEPPKSAEESARLFFNGENITAEEAMNLAARLPKTTNADQDAIYRLYYFASEQNNPAGLMEYANCLDPAKPHWGTIQKDGALAYEAYQKAAQAGAPGADEAAGALKSWLQSKAASGDAQARIWLNQIGI